MLERPEGGSGVEKLSPQQLSELNLQQCVNKLNRRASTDM